MKSNSLYHEPHIFKILNRFFHSMNGVLSETGCIDHIVSLILFVFLFFNGFNFGTIQSMNLFRDFP